MLKTSILIVDDELNVTKLLEKVFIKEGYNTYIASSGKEALSIIDSHCIDIIITDIKMPGMTGIELLSEIKSIDPCIEVILITAFATMETAIEALKIGARDYITKPFSLKEVLLSVKKISRGSAKLQQLEPIDNYFFSESKIMENVLQLIKQVADTKATIMIYGETGTGKGLAAQALHNLSGRRDKPFIKVNCAAIPETLLESELFGYEKGAFTGAIINKPGRFELAHGGTIFLDEIGDITPLMQVKLLKVMQEREFERLGGTKTIKIDVRIIAATNKNLEELVREGVFRQDLYYRLNVVPMKIPSLRERKEDINSLVDYFLLKSSNISGKGKKEITKEALMQLINHNWPGNIRELENVIERCVVITTSKVIDVKDLPEYIWKSHEYEDDIQGKLNDAVDIAEKNIIIKTLEECDGNKTKTSQILGISRRSLHRKISKYNIED
ncbi:sigma-54-dependent Fis family transcriptional regulator [Clostridium sp. P21]|uniref:Stage 0 sporulation protein A homolog n=1 Tax=Clostridium muellerianum TaxID=2716538 RepID=A0A7Y0EL16_9CLOT|nr:sigma-54 dependent transcriptional regulator [Clostridium muellerianum]NMM65434.1 sigma-54-dependent Fis family transcriptional regulator [Clostridium muellerianum]